MLTPDPDRCCGRSAASSSYRSRSGGHGGARVSSCVMALLRCGGCGYAASTDDDAAPARRGIEHRVQITPADSGCDALKQREVHRADDIAVPRGQRMERAIAQADAGRAGNRLEAMLGERGLHDLARARVLATLRRPAATSGTPDLCAMLARGPPEPRQRGAALL